MLQVHIYNVIILTPLGQHSSDERIKKILKLLSLGLDFINELKPVTYKFKAPSEYPTDWESYDADKTKPADARCATWNDCPRC
jgi:cyanate lyase